MGEWAAHQSCSPKLLTTLCCLVAAVLINKEEQFLEKSILPDAVVPRIAGNTAADMPAFECRSLSLTQLLCKAPELVSCKAPELVPYDVVNVCT